MAVTIVVDGGKVTVSTDDKAAAPEAIRLVEAWKKEDLQKNGMAKLASAGRKAPLLLVEPPTVPATRPRKVRKSLVPIASLREVALSLGINTDGLGRKDLQGRIDKVLGQAIRAVQEQEQRKQQEPAAPRVIEGNTVVGLKSKPPSIKQVSIDDLRWKAESLGINVDCLGSEKRAIQWLIDEAIRKGNPLTAHLAPTPTPKGLPLWRLRRAQRRATPHGGPSPVPVLAPPVSWSAVERRLGNA